MLINENQHTTKNINFHQISSYIVKRNITTDLYIFWPLLSFFNVYIDMIQQ